MQCSNNENENTVVNMTRRAKNRRAVTCRTVNRKVVTFLLLLLCAISALPLSACAGTKTRTLPPSPQSVEELSGCNVGAITTTSFADALLARVPDANIEFFDSSSVEIVELTAGRIDAFLADEPDAQLICGKTNEVAIMPENISDNYYAFAMSKENTELYARVNEAIQQLSDAGELERLENKWMRGAEAEKVMPEIPATGENGVLRFATVAASEPFAYVNNTGVPVGYDVETAVCIANMLGMGLTIEDMDFSALLQAVSTGKVDLASACINATDERSERVRFTLPSYHGGIVAVVRNDSSEYTSTTEFNGETVGVMYGTDYEKNLLKRSPNAEITYYVDEQMAVQSVKTGQIEACLLTERYARNLCGSDGTLAVLPDAVLGLSCAIAVNKKNAQLLRDVNECITIMCEDGTFDEMRERWLCEDYHKSAIPGIQLSPRNGTLRVLARQCEPYYYYDEYGYVSGFEAELIVRVAAMLDMEVEFVDDGQDIALFDVVKGNVDVAIGCIPVTDAREKMVSFTKQLYTEHVVAVVRRTELTSETTWLERVENSFRVNILQEQRWALILDGLKTTLIITFFSGILGLAVGVGFYAMRMSRSRFVAGLARLIINILQSTPVVVLLLVVCYVIFVRVNAPVFIAILTFGVNFAASVAEILRDSMAVVEHGQREAAFVSGFSRKQAFLYVVLPQAVRHALPPLQTELVSMMKSTSVAGYIAIQDLTKVSDIIRSRTYEAFFPLIFVAVLYFVLSWVIRKLISLAKLRFDRTLRARVLKLKGGSDDR